MIKFIISSLVVILCFSQCKKKKLLTYCEKCPEGCVDIMTVKDHFYFDVGTYWVYEEETSGQIDSQWVSQAFTLPNVCWFDYDIKSNLSSFISEIKTELLASAIDSGLVKKEVSIYVNRTKYKSGKLIGGSILSPFYYPFNEVIYNYGGTDYISNLTVKKLHNQLLVNDILFTDVLEISEDKNIAENDQSTNHYYAKNIGLVKKELIDSNQAWNLIRYHIVK